MLQLKADIHIASLLAPGVPDVSEENHEQFETAHRAVEAEEEARDLFVKARNRTEESVADMRVARARRVLNGEKLGDENLEVDRLSRSGQRPPQVEALVTRATEAFESSVTEGITLMREAASLLADTGNTEEQADVLLSLAATLQTLSESESVTPASEAVELYRSLGDAANHWRCARALQIMAEVGLLRIQRESVEDARTEKLDSVVKASTEAVSLFRGAVPADHMSLAVALHTHATACMEARKISADKTSPACLGASASAKEAQRLFHEFGGIEDEATAALTLSYAYVSEGKTIEARKAAQAAKALFDQVSNKEGEAQAQAILDSAGPAKRGRAAGGPKPFSGRYTGKFS